MTERIRESRVKVLSQNMQPKSLYLGQSEWAELQGSPEFVRHSSYASDINNTPHEFMGFDVYVVMQPSHYVVTGE